MSYNFQRAAMFFLTRRRSKRGARSSGPSNDVVYHQRDVDSLYEEHFEFVYRNLRRLGCAREDAEDLVQEVFLLAHRKLERPQKIESAKGWLYALARGVKSNHARAVIRRETRESSYVPPKRNAVLPDAKLEQEERLQRLVAMLDRLGAKKREVFVMIELEEMSAPEVARALDLPLGTVYARLRAGRLKFRTMIGEVAASEMPREQTAPLRLEALS